ncbi:MAG: heparinase II/III family protein [Gaiellaceae bacterium]
MGRELTYPPADWEASDLERVRRFHLHYGEEILGCARSSEPALLDVARRALASWIERNPPARGDAWHPYTVSTRVGNWIAALALEPALGGSEVNESLWRQLAYLERNVEHDILGNHLIRNARALILGGLAFDQQRLVRRGIALLEGELPEQILADGGHYERSPVYHAIVLRDLLEVRAAAGLDTLDATIDRMLQFAAATTRPDGVPALFNDGTRELAPDLRMLHPPQNDGLAIFAETGYAVLRTGSVWLALDCGPPAPHFLPPHAHADALSFQLWVDGRPVVVDPGTPTYEPGPLRNRCRSTSSHATVTVDARDQFLLWGAFRAGRLPRVKLMDVSGTASSGTVVAAAWKFEPLPGLRHERRISWNADCIDVDDQLTGRERRLLESRLPLPPGTSPDSVPVEPRDGDHHVESGEVAEELFAPQPAPVLVARRRSSLPASLGWRIRLAAKGLA